MSRPYERASETASALVASCLDPDIDLRAQVVRAVRGSSLIGLVDLIEVLVREVGKARSGNEGGQ